MRQFSQEQPDVRSQKRLSGPAATPQQRELQNSQPDYVRADDPVEEEDYNYVPVSQMKNKFVEKPERAPKRKWSLCMPRDYDVVMVFVILVVDSIFKTSKFHSMAF